MLRALDENTTGLDKELLSIEGLNIAEQLYSDIQTKTSKGTEEIMELRRLGLIERARIGSSNIYFLSPEGKELLGTIRKEDPNRAFFKVIYEKEPLFQKLIDMLQRRHKIYPEDMLEISGTNSVRISFLKAILEQLPFIARFGKDGRRTYIEYVTNIDMSISNIRRIIVQSYSSLIGNKLFVPIDDLWKSVRQSLPNISEEDFDNAIINLTEEYLGMVELSQGVASSTSKILHDKRSGTYFHYIKIPRQVLDSEL